MKKILEYTEVSLSDTERIATQIVENIPDGAIILMQGEMGAGKTTLIKEIVRQLGSDDVVSSPTFSIVNQYLTHRGESIYHFDFYRIDDIAEAYDMGCEEYFYSGDICMIEWGEKIASILPPATMSIDIEKTESGRNISVFSAE